MALPLRKIFQKNLLPGAESAAGARPQEGARAPVREGRSGGRRRTLDLSGAAAAALGLALVAAVGWAFFMGYLVGRGEHPERSVESVAGLLRPGAPSKTGEAPRNAPLPGEEVLLEAATPAAPESAPAPASGAARQGAPEAAPETPPQAVAPAAPAPAETGSAASAYPFNRPQGESLAAWGISPEGTPAPRPAPAAPGEAAQKPAAQAAASAQPRKAAPPPAPAEPRFDYLFQAAAFKGPVDAERLRGRLAAAGLRASVRQSGKVRLVLVSLRGTAQEAQKVRGQLSGMGLGRPIQLEKKPVAEKTGGKGRRRSAP
ncbi:MAG: SPOR domain-containing protein [Desulfovibrio sp.]|uniref:SPOR domain-containing protein n=1 Tax=Desulfovibrio sp. TaxID=885 RepID=UPI001A64FEFB|nr:SPOR domain-containing protein [Desulfovibrio sp.]MBD5416630.1 SPOR domain-containing protein [Desulfovibrio sp.]